MLFDMSQTVLHVMNVIIRFILHDCTCLVGDGRLGYPNRGPYDAIHVGAAAKEMPQSVKKRIFGIIVRYVGTNITIFSFL